MLQLPLGERLGAGKGAEVFAYGERVLKLYRTPSGKPAVFREAAALAVVAATGLPVPVVIEAGPFDGGWGLVMSRAPGRAFAEAMLADPQQVPRHFAAMAAVHHRIHAQQVHALPSLKARLAFNMGRAPRLGETLRQSLLARLAALPEGDRLCHGDFHPFNIMGSLDSPIVIDWLDATIGPPAADLCRSYVLMRQIDRALADAYVAAYAPADDYRQWLPFVAAARLSENVPEEEAALLDLAAGAA